MLLFSPATLTGASFFGRGDSDVKSCWVEQYKFGSLRRDIRSEIFVLNTTLIINSKSLLTARCLNSQRCCPLNVTKLYCGRAVWMLIIWRPVIIRTQDFIFDLIHVLKAIVEKYIVKNERLKITVHCWKSSRGSFYCTGWVIRKFIAISPWNSSERAMWLSFER